MQANTVLVMTIGLSILAQVVAAWVALRQMATVKGRYRLAWGCVSLALALMVERRLAPLWRLIQNGEASNQGDAAFGLAISTLMVVGTYGIRRLFADLEKQRAELNALAHTDALTGLANRRDVLQHAEQEIRRAERTRRPVAFLMFDIDHFKQVNDAYGHSVGDGVLRGIADIARSEFRRIDTCGRIGGEEFLVVMPESDRESARTAAERLRAAIAAHEFPVGDKNFRVTISIGVVVPDIWEKSAAVDDLLVAVDKALYMAKDGGRNQVVVI